MQTGFHKKQLIIGLIILLIIMSLFLHNRDQGVDEEHYLTWGYSFFADADLFLLNQREQLRQSYHLTSTGYVGELWNFGAPLFWLPFYGMAAIFGGATVANLRNSVTFLFINWSSYLFVGFALGVTAIAAINYLKLPMSWMAFGSILLGTPLFFYTAQRPISAHPVSVFFASSLLFLVAKPKLNRGRYFSMGVIVGWSMLVAPYNFVLLTLPLVVIFFNFISIKDWRSFIVAGSVFTLGALLGFLPQMIGWRALYGGFTASPYAAQLSWFTPHVGETLFSTFHGLFIYAPVLLVAPIGLVLFMRSNFAIAVGMGITWIMLTYIVSVNLPWWAGASFGNRYFLVLTPFFIVALSALFAHSRWWLLFTIPAVVWTLALWLQTLDNTLKIGEANFYTLSSLTVNQIRGVQNILRLGEIFTQNWLFTTPFSTILILYGLSIAILGFGFFVIYFFNKNFDFQMSVFLGGIGLFLILAVYVFWQRAEVQRLLIAETGFYEMPHRVSNHDPVDLSKTYLDRAAYYQFIGDDQRSLNDLKTAAQVWYSPSRQIFGPSNISPLPEIFYSANLFYGQELRLIGYSWRNESQLLLYWEKLSKVSERSYVPVIQLFNKKGVLVWEGAVVDPFPARYIPAGYIFIDTLDIPQNKAFDEFPLWIQITFPSHNESIKTDSDQLHSGIIPLVNPNALIPVHQPTSLKPLKIEPLAPSFSSGDRVGFYLEWSHLQAMQLPNSGQVNLVDKQNRSVLQQSFNLFLHNAQPPTSTEPRWVFPQTLCLDTPPLLIEGKYQMILTVTSTEGDYHKIPIGDIVIHQNSHTDTICNLLSSANPERKYQPLPDVTNIDSFDNQIALLGYKLVPNFATTPPEIGINFQWQALVNNPVSAQPRLRLASEANETFFRFSWEPVWGTQPVVDWLVGEVITDSIQVAIPDLPSGKYKLQLEWEDRTTGRLMRLDGNQQASVVLFDFEK